MDTHLTRKDFLTMAATGAAAVSMTSNSHAAGEEPAFAPELFVAKRIPNGFSWTLASRLGEMLHRAEELFGPRDPAWTILGVEIGPDTPRLWYPGNRRSVVVQLASSASHHIPRACYQLAHETVHLLAPNGGGPAINFEEAVACWFAGHFMKTAFKESTWHPELPSYIKGLNLISARMDADPGCVRRLRARQPTFSGIRKDELAAEFPDLGPDDLDFLLAGFQRGDGPAATSKPPK